MKAQRNWLYITILFAFNLISTPAHSTSIAVLIGVDYAPASQKWAVDATDMFNALSGLPGWIVASRTDNAENLSAQQIVTIIQTFTSIATKDDGFLFYYSGHGSFLDQPADREITPPNGKAMDHWDESLWVSPQEFITDDVLKAALGTLPSETNLLVFLDTCFGGGFWGGSDVGDLDRLPSTTLIAAATETGIAPGTSQITKNFVADIKARGLDLDRPGGSTDLGAMYNRIKTNIIVANRKGDPDIPPENYNPLSFVDPENTYGSVFYTNVPEPSTILLLGTGLLGLATAARRKRNQ